MKTNKFDIRRFWMLFSTEFTTGIKKNWASLLIISCLSLIIFLIIGIFSLILTGRFTLMTGNIGTRAAITGLYLVMVGIIFPAKLYGHVNERGSGTLYLLLPASRLEKYLSMILNCVVATPLLSAAIFLGIDAAICGVCTQIQGSSEVIYGTSIKDFTPLAAVMFKNLGSCISGMPDLVDLDSIISLNNFTPASGAVSLFFWLEVFLLGALCFKGNKQSKTLLAVIVIYIVGGIVLSNLVMIVAAIHGEGILESLGNRHYNLTAISAMWNVTINAVMLTAIWFKLKSLKA